MKLWDSVFYFLLEYISKIRIYRDLEDISLPKSWKSSTIQVYLGCLEVFYTLPWKQHYLFSRRSSLVQCTPLPSPPLAQTPNSLLRLLLFVCLFVCLGDFFGGEGGGVDETKKKWVRSAGKAGKDGTGNRIHMVAGSGKNRRKIKQHGFTFGKSKNGKAKRWAPVKRGENWE